jgi:hypothetical protein
MGCGLGPGGERAASEGVCPAAEATEADGLNQGTNGGRLCWACAGSFRGVPARGRFAKELPSCLSCEFFQRVRVEASPFSLMKPGARFRPGVLGGSPAAPGESVRAAMPRGTTLNCWEYFHCGREAGGERVDELGVCPAASHRASDGLNRGVNAGRACWRIAGTFCFDEIQGSFAQKAASCLGCEFFVAVRAEEGGAFLLMRPGEVFDEH